MRGKDDQDSVCCKIFGVVSKIDICSCCSSFDTDDSGKCKNISEEWRF